MMTLAEIRKIPKPQTAADYATAYEANLREAREKLRAASRAVGALWREGLIFDATDPKTGEVKRMCKGDVAKEAWGEWCRWNADVDHWVRRFREAREPGFSARPIGDPGAVEFTPTQLGEQLRQWRERQAGDDDAADFAADEGGPPPEEQFP